MAHEFFEDKRPHNGMTYEEFKKKSVEEIENIEPEKLEGIDKKYYEYRKINQQRSKRLDKHFQPSEELIELVKRIDEPQLWMVMNYSNGDRDQIPLKHLSKTLHMMVFLKKNSISNFICGMGEIEGKSWKGN
jgi:hypothetical protein